MEKKSRYQKKSKIEKQSIDFSNHREMLRDNCAFIRFHFDPDYKNNFLNKSVVPLMGWTIEKSSERVVKNEVAKHWEPTI